MCFTIILRAILLKESKEKDWKKFGKYKLDLIQDKDLRTKLEWY